MVISVGAISRDGVRDNVIYWNSFIFQGCKQSYEPPHDKTNKMTVCPSEDSDQPGHLPSLIRVFTVCMKKAWVLSYLLAQGKTLIRLSECQADLSLRGAHKSFCWFCHEAAHLINRILHPHLSLVMRKSVRGFRPGKTQTGLCSHRS